MHALLSRVAFLPRMETFNRSKTALDEWNFGGCKTLAALLQRYLAVRLRVYKTFKGERIEKARKELKGIIAFEAHGGFHTRGQQGI